MARGSNTTHLVTSLQALIDQEHDLTAGARDRLGSFVEVALSAIGTMNTFIVSIEHDHVLAAALQLAMQKSATLAYLSYVRSHHAQAEFNIRQTVEYTSLCAFLLAHPDLDVTNDGGGFRSSQALREKAFKWMDKAHPHLSQLLVQLKRQINDTTAHASVYLTHYTFDWQASIGETFQGSFFDEIDPNITRLGLLSLSWAILTVVETLRMTSEMYGGLVLREGIHRELAILQERIVAHRASLMAAMKVEPSSSPT